MHDDDHEVGGDAGARKYAPGSAHGGSAHRVSPPTAPGTGSAERPPTVLSARCPSRRTLELIADKWTLLVIAAITRGHTRNGQLLREVGGISQKVLTQVLRRLEADGLLSRTVVAARPLHVEYALTDVGRSLVPVVDALGRWAEAHPGLGARAEA